MVVCHEREGALNETKAPIEMRSYFKLKFVHQFRIIPAQTEHTPHCE